MVRIFKKNAKQMCNVSAFKKNIKTMLCIWCSWVLVAPKGKVVLSAFATWGRKKERKEFFT